MEEVKEEKRRRAGKRYWVVKRGKLYARLQYLDDAGDKRDKYKLITDKRTASSQVEKMRQELKTHGSEILQSDKMTFSDVAERYERVKFIEPQYSNGVKVAGKRSLGPSRSSIKPLKEYFGKRHIRTIKVSDLETYKNKRLNTPVEIEHNVKVEIENPPPGSRKKYFVVKKTVARPRKVASVNRELELLRAIFNFAVEEEWLIKSPFSRRKGIIPKTAEVERDRVLSFKEESDLLAACVDQRKHLKAILICALDTAMRRGEIFKMRWKDIDFDSGEITIPKKNTKTDAQRTVCMTPRLKSALEELKQVALPQEAPRPEDLVFGITSTVKTAWDTLRNNAAITEFRLHDCRHTATTRMIASGSPHMEVMKITGHTQLKTFLRYLNITPETARNVSNRLSEYLNQNRRQD